MKRTNLDSWIETIEGIPHLTRENLEELQLRRLNETLKRLKDRGGINEDYPDKLETLSQLQTLPFTTAQMLAEHPGRFLMTSQAEVSRVISGATSGTTGPAKRVFYTQADMEHTMGLFTAGISEMLALLEETKPETYIGFPVTLLSLIQLYSDVFPVKRALVSGDACPAGVMEELEQALGNKLYPHYGSRECGLGGAVTCPAFEGMHLRENHIIPKIIDEAGNVLPDGEYGELVLTTIGAEAMPLIRYRTGDYTRILPPCKCGGVTRRLDAVSRREREISIEKLDSALFRIPGLVDYRASWDSKLSIEAYGNLFSGTAI